MSEQIKNDFGFKNLFDNEKYLIVLIKLYDIAYYFSKKLDGFSKYPDQVKQIIDNFYNLLIDPSSVINLNLIDVFKIKLNCFATEIYNINRKGSYDQILYQLIE
jgi:hypothetical protein